MAGQPQVVAKAGEPSQKPVPMEHRAVFEAALHDMRHKYGVPADRAEVLARRLTVIHAKIRHICLLSDRHKHLANAVRGLKAEPDHELRRNGVATVSILGRENAMLSAAAIAGTKPELGMMSTSRAVDLCIRLFSHSINDPFGNGYITDESKNRAFPPYELLAAAGETAIMNVSRDMAAAMQRAVPIPCATDDTSMDKVADDLVKEFEEGGFEGKIGSLRTDAASDWRAIWSEVIANATKEKGNASAERAYADREFGELTEKVHTLFSPLFGPVRP